MTHVQSIIDHNGNGVLVTVECHISNSLPNIVVVGFAHRSVAEAKERIRAALVNSGIRVPRRRITLNLSPADIPKEGSSFDLAMLMSILNRTQMIHHTPDNQTIVLGEVGLDGSIRPIRGIIGKILLAKQSGITKFWIPTDNMAQASLIAGVKLYGFTTVKDLYWQITQTQPMAKSVPPASKVAAPLQAVVSSLDDVVGQQTAKRALLIAAAGHHNILLSGPPGTGKTMLATALLDILPRLTRQEQLTVTHLHSLASTDFDHIMTERPFRAPLASASTASILGGGGSAQPGEITLSHHGVLFLDEFAEFRHSVIEALRQPLESKAITIARAKQRVTYPADFLLIAATNPCPCGYNGSSKKCVCSPKQVAAYQKRISGPIIDRIDLYAESEAIPHQKLLTSHNIGSETSLFQKQIVSARKIQYTRSGKRNSELTSHELMQTGLSPTAKSLLDQVAARIHLSARGYIRTLRVARTIADLENSPDITDTHVGEALQYRKR